MHFLTKLPYFAVNGEEVTSCCNCSLQQHKSHKYRTNVSVEFPASNFRFEKDVPP
jgi:hypothetical protein